MKVEKLELILNIPDNEEANAIGSLFKVFAKVRQSNDKFVIADKKLNLEITSEVGFSEELLSAISNLPFQYVEHLDIPEEFDKAEPHETEDNTIERTGDIETISEIRDEETSETTETIIDDETSKTNVSEITEGKPHRKRSIAGHELDKAGLEIIESIAKKSDSFDNYIQNLIEFLGISEHYHSFFKALIKTVCDLDDASTKLVAVNIGKYGETLSNTNRVTISNKIKKAFEKAQSNVRFTDFLEGVSLCYKKFGFSVNSAEETEFTGETKPEFKLLSDEILEEIKKQGATDFSSKVAFVLDKIKCENDMAFYNEVSGLLVQLIVKVTEELSNGEPFFPVFENNSKEIFGNNAYMARAYLLQSIKDYSISVGFTDETRTTVFFDDLIRLM